MNKILRTIFIGGKEIGYNSLHFLINNNNKPLYCVPNLDDNKKNKIWHKSTLEIAKRKKIKILNLLELKDKIIKKKIKDIDVIFCIGSTQILPLEVVSFPKLGCLNLHPSLLPKYRGRYSTVHAIFNGEKKTGVTAHWIGEKIDSGKIIKKKIIKIKETDTAKDVYDKFTAEAFKLFKNIFRIILKKNKINSYKMSVKKMNYHKKLLPNNGIINWKWSGIKIFNFIRALTFPPFSPPSFFIGDKKFIIIEEKIAKVKYLKSPK